MGGFENCPILRNICGGKKIPDGPRIVCCFEDFIIYNKNKIIYN